MLENLIPKAYAQGVVGTVRTTAQAGADVAVDKSEQGLQALVSYVATNIDNWIAGIVIIAIFYILARMASAAIKQAIIKEKEDIQESALILIERVTRLSVLLIGVTIAFAINGLNFTAVIGALSLGIGFALKDIIGNFISGVIMLAQDRVKIGDFIKVNDILGTIVNIDTRATILQAVDGTEVVIPNQMMLGETLISYTTNPFRRIEIVVGVDYGTDLPMVTSLVKGIIDKDESIVVKPEPQILVSEFGDSAINVTIRFWVESSADWQGIRSNLASKIKHAFDDLGVNIPFPIRTLKLDEDDRAVLKTMDSMKKGVVPEEKAAPSTDEVAKAAEKTKEDVKIPYSIFEPHEVHGHAPDEHEIKPAAQKEREAEIAKQKGEAVPAPTVPNEAPTAEPAPVAAAPKEAATPAPTAPTAPTKPAAQTPAEAPAVETPKQPVAAAPTPTPPPTHL